MRRLLLLICLLNCFALPSYAKLEALAIMTKHCGTKELQIAGKGHIAKIVSEFNGKGLHGYVIELNTRHMSKVQLSENLIKQGCYKERRPLQDKDLLPEDLLSDSGINDALLDSPDV